MRHHDDCPHCHAHASIDRPSALRWVVHATAWLYAFGSVFGAILTGPIIIGLLPPLFAGGACLISFSYAWASTAPECRSCGKLAAAPHRAASVRAFEGARQHA